MSLACAWGYSFTLQNSKAAIHFAQDFVKNMRSISIPAMLTPRLLPISVQRVIAILIAGIALFLSGLSAKGEEAAAKYPFPLPPRTILERLGEMQLGKPPAIGAQEWQILDAAWAQRDATAAEKRKPEYQRLVFDALLAASGVTTAAGQAEYRQKLKAVVDGARAAVEKDKASVHPGESLMKYLHAGVMKGGYVAEQSSFADIFDSNTHNCVSSTAMYYVVGRELGLEMRIIGIPGNRWMCGHACLDLIDGPTTFEVEPTNPNGFDWGTKLKQPGVFTIGPQVDRKDGHTIDGLGLALSIYSNRGVAAANAKEPAQPDQLAAASLGLRAMMCGAYDRGAANNVVAVFANWGPELAAAGKYDEGTRALAFGITATGDDAVTHNFLVTACEQIDELLKNKKDREAQAAIEKATAVLPMATEFQKSGPWYRYADRCFDKEGGEAGLAALDRALKSAPAADHEALSAYRIELLRRWSHDLLKEEDFAGALKLLIRAYKLDPNHGELHGSIGYHVQESMYTLSKEGTDPTAAMTHYRAVAAAFPEAKVVGEMGMAHAERSLSRLCDALKFKEALATVAVYDPIADAVGQRGNLSARVYGEWGHHLKTEKKWTAAVEKYLEGLKVVPNHDRLLSGAMRTIDDWADESMSANDWDAAIKCYDRGLVYLPDNGHLKNNRDYCVAKKLEATGKK